jgi:hypothetical protein
MQPVRDVPSSTPRVLVERPPEGLLRGREASSPWLLAAIACVVVALVAGFYFTRLRKRSKQ